MTKRDLINLLAGYSDDADLRVCINRGNSVFAERAEIWSKPTPENDEPQPEGCLEIEVHFYTA